MYLFFFISLYHLHITIKCMILFIFIKLIFVSPVNQQKKRKIDLMGIKKCFMLECSVCVNCFLFSMLDEKSLP